MSDLQLKRIQLRNWEQVKTADITFPDKGLVLVLGSNLASDGKLQSVGSGKTSLGEALSRALAGVTGRFQELGDYAPDGSKVNTLVTVEAMLFGKPLLVEMGYKCPELSRTGEGLRFTYDGKTVQRGHVDQTREELSRIVRVTPELADWTVFIDGDKLRFNRMSQQDSVNLLMTALNQPPWTEYYERATKVLRDSERLVAVARQALSSSKMRLEGLNSALQNAYADQEDAEKAVKRKEDEAKEDIANLRIAVTNDKNAIEAAEAVIIKLRKQLSLLEEQFAARNHQLDIKRQGLRDRLAVAEEQQAAANRELSATRQEWRDKLSKLEKDQAAETSDLSAKRREAKTALAAFDANKWRKASDAVAAAEADYRQAEKELRETVAAPANCPKCGKPWTQAHSEEEKDKATHACLSVKSTLDRAREKLDLVIKDRQNLLGDIAELDDQLNSNEWAKKRRAIQAEIEAVDESMADTEAAKNRRAIQAEIQSIDESMKADGHTEDYREVSTKITRNDTLIKNLTALSQQRELRIAALEKAVDRSSVHKAVAIVGERQRALQTGKEAIDVAANNLAEEEQALTVIQYWHKAYGPTGIPNMVLADAIAPLNRVAQRISSLMTGGTLNISYATSRMLVKGSSKAELVIKVDNKIGSKKIQGSSKGEAGLTNLIIAENLSEIGQVSNRVGFRWYDEVTSGQDQVVRRSIFSYLQEVAQRLGILIFVVDHHPEAASYADRVLMAEKTKEHGTRFFWR